MAKLTRNFSGAQIEDLVSAALSAANNRLVKSRMKVDPEASEKLMVCREDFLYALNNEVEAVSRRLELTSSSIGINEY